MRWLFPCAVLIACVVALPFLDAGQPDPNVELKDKFKKLVNEWSGQGPSQRQISLEELTKGMPPRHREAILNYFAKLPAFDGKEIFNGKDLAGWDTWLGKPTKGDKAVGLNNDPDKVYTVVEADGKPAIRISGQTFGALTTKDEFENYHLTLEFKWGEKRWPPREKAVRDSGLLYHCVGPQGAQGTFWMRSQELQIQEKDCGDYWSVAGAIVDVEGVRKDGKGSVTYMKGGEKFTVPTKETTSRIIKSPDNEKPTGKWNTIELYCVGQTSVHVVNGKVVMVLTGSRQVVDTKEVPLTRGKIQLQSEGAEVFYRNITIQPLERIPEALLK